MTTIFHLELGVNQHNPFAQLLGEEESVGEWTHCAENIQALVTFCCQILNRGDGYPPQEPKFIRVKKYEAMDESDALVGYDTHYNFSEKDLEELYDICKINEHNDDWRIEFQELWNYIHGKLKHLENTTYSCFKDREYGRNSYGKIIEFKQEYIQF